MWVNRLTRLKGLICSSIVIVGLGCGNINLSDVAYVDFVGRNILMGDTRGNLLLIDLEDCKVVDSLATGEVAPEWRKLTRSGHLIVPSPIISKAESPRVVRMDRSSMALEDLALDGVSENFRPAEFHFSEDLKHLFVSVTGALDAPNMAKWYLAKKAGQEYAVQKVFEFPPKNDLGVIRSFYYSENELVIQGGSRVFIYSADSSQGYFIEAKGLENTSIATIVGMQGRNLLIHADRFVGERIVPTLIMYDLEKQTIVRDIPLSQSGAIVTSFDYGGDYAAFVLSNNEAIFINVHSGKTYFLDDLQEKAHLVRVSPSGEHFLLLQDRRVFVMATKRIENPGFDVAGQKESQCELLGVGFEGVGGI